MANDASKLEVLPPMGDEEASEFMRAEHERIAEEREYFDAHREAWVSEGRSGLFVLVKGRRAHGFFPSFEEAYERGEALFGDAATMLIKRVAPRDDVLSVSPGLLHGNLIVGE